MKSNQKEMIAAFVRDGRLAKGYTQKELSDLSNISVRSIQRIENGEIVPRSYTLKTLAGLLDQSYEEFAKLLHEKTRLESEKSTVEQEGDAVIQLTKPQRIILSVGVSIAVFLLAWAFIAQSPTFPETTFELLIFLTIVILIISAVLLLLWKKRK